MNLNQTEYQEGFKAVPVLVQYTPAMELKQKAVRYKVAGAAKRPDYWRGIFDGLSLWERIITQPLVANFS